MDFGNDSECDQLLEMLDNLHGSHDHLWEENEDNQFLWALSHYDETAMTMYHHLDAAVADEEVTTQLEAELEYVLEDDQARAFASAVTSDTQ